MSWELSCLVFIWQKRLHQYYVAVHLFLSVFVGFRCDKSFNIFVGEGHESFACRIFGCIARGHRKLLVVISFFQTSEASRESMGKPLSKMAQKKSRVTSQKLIGRTFQMYKLS